MPLTGQTGLWPNTTYGTIAMPEGAPLSKTGYTVQGGQQVGTGGGGPTYVPSLDFSDPRNSQYLTIIFSPLGL